jgi:outer membrane receptor protein involved in Fe transport
MENTLRDAVRYALVAGAAASVASPAVFAQDEDAAELGKVQVTGSRISRTDIETSNPVFVVTREDIDRTGLVGIGEILEELPIAGSGLNTVFNNGGDGSVRLDLRNLGSNRTLVLVNGRRWVNAVGGGGAGFSSVDLNTIPASIVERIEVLKDGASAIYGSDAVAGVVNIITKRDFQGMEANAQYGAYDESDGDTYAYDFSVGATTATTSAFMNFSYVKQEEVWAGDRDISQEPTYGTGNTRGSSTLPQGRFYLLDADTSYLLTTNAGSPQPDCSSSGSLLIDDCIGTGDGGSFKNYSPQDAFNFAPDNYLLTPNQRWNLYGQLSHAITDNINFVTEALYHHRESDQYLAPTPLVLWYTSATGSIGADNPYNPWPGQEIEPYLADGDGGITYAGLQRRMKEAGGRNFEQDVDMFRIGGGFEGSFEAFNRYFDWDVNYIYGEGDGNDQTAGLLNTTNVQKAMGPLAGCVGSNNVNQDGTWNGLPGADGCVPFNWFGGQGVDGSGTIDQDQVDYVTFTAQDANTYEMQNFLTNLSGELFDLPAGPLGAAIGYEWRQEKGSDTPDAIIATGQTSGNSRSPTKGQYDVKEAYGEVVVPILADLPFAHTLEFNAAWRYTDYSTFGDDTTSKYGVKWKPFNDLLLRGTVSEAFRAPNVAELFGGQSDSYPSITDPCTDWQTKDATVQANCQADGVPANYAQANEQIRITVGSNPNLQAESSDNYTFGIVYTPSWLENFALYVDWYRIELKDTITPVGAQTILNGCYTEESRAFCGLITRAPTGDISDLLNAAVNIGSTDVEGIDFLVLYTFPETRFGEFKVAWDTSYVDEYKVNDGFGNEYEFQGENLGDVGFPRWKSNLDLTWAYGNWGASWQMRYIHHQDEGCGDNFDGSATLSLSALDLCSQPYKEYWFTGDEGTNTLGSTTYHDVQVTYDTPWYNSRITLGVNNVTDKDAPTSYSAFANSFDPTLYEVNGRFPYARLSVRF